MKKKINYGLLIIPIILVILQLIRGYGYFVYKYSDIVSKSSQNTISSSSIDHSNKIIEFAGNKIMIAPYTTGVQVNKFTELNDNSDYTNHNKFDIIAFYEAADMDYVSAVDKDNLNIITYKRKLKFKDLEKVENGYNIQDESINFHSLDSSLKDKFENKTEYSSKAPISRIVSAIGSKFILPVLNPEGKYQMMVFSENKLSEISLKEIYGEKIESIVKYGTKDLAPVYRILYDGKEDYFIINSSLSVSKISNPESTDEFISAFYQKKGPMMKETYKKVMASIDLKNPRAVFLSDSILFIGENDTGKVIIKEFGAEGNLIELREKKYFDYMARDFVADNINDSLTTESTYNINDVDKRSSESQTIKSLKENSALDSFDHDRLKMENSVSNPTKLKIYLLQHTSRVTILFLMVYTASLIWFIRKKEKKVNETDEK